MFVLGIYSIKPIEEAYYGQTKDIKKIQMALTKFRSKYVTDGFNYNPKINSDPDLYAFNHTIEDAFGFEVFSLTIELTRSVNAYTIPIGMKLDAVPMKNIVKTNNGYRYDKKAGYAITVVLYAGLFCNSYFTDREVLAMILHEIGHNFSGAINKRIGVLHEANIVIMWATIMSQIMMGIAILDPISMVSLSNQGTKLLIEFNRYIRDKHSTIATAGDYVAYIINQIIDAIGEANFIVGIIMTPIIPLSYMKYILDTLYSKGISMIHNPDYGVRLVTYGYSDEQFADRFATIYGYGPDLNSALAKVDDCPGNGSITGKILKKKAPIILAINNLALFPIEMVVRSFDEHPLDPARLTSSLDILQSSLKDASPEMRSRINHDIKEIKKVQTKYYECRKDMDKNSNIDIHAAKRLYYGWLINNIHGDIKHFIYDTLFNNTKAMK